MIYNKHILRTFCLAFVMISSTFAGVGIIKATNNSLTQTSISEQTIFNNVDTLFNDTIYGGYYDAIYENGTVSSKSSNKYLLDYITALEVIITKLQNTNQSPTAQENIQIMNYLHFINKFKNLDDSGYFRMEHNDWSETQSLFWSDSSARLITLFCNLYSLTENTTYLGFAIKNYEFLQQYFYIKDLGVYLNHIESSFQNDLGLSINIGTYGTIARAILSLSELTNNQTLLLSGIHFLQNLISLNFDTNNNFFYQEFKPNSNQSDPIFADFYLPYQLDIADALLLYSNVSVVTNLTGDFRTEFISVADKIYYSIIDNLLLNNNLIRADYNVKSKIVQSDIDAGIQRQFYDFLLLRKQYDPNYNSFDEQLLDQSSLILSSFLSSKANLFLESKINPISTPSLNYELLKTILNLKNNGFSAPLYPQDTSLFVYPSATYNANAILNKNSNENNLLILILAIVALSIIFLTYNHKKNSEEIKEEINKEKFYDHSELNKGKDNVQGQPNNIFCPKCKNEILFNDNFCQNCGFILR